ncbi:MAG: quinone oxidoreductase [Rhodospirillaceae bacterium]|nr:quinone oxidoreductase [Rhodospirillaceae bacterium]
MTKVICIHETGGPEVLSWEDRTLENPAEGQVRIKHTAIGLNMIDCYQRSGLYPIDLPMILGSEATGVVQEIGPGVKNLSTGQRVTYSGRGAYSEERNIDAKELITLPNGIEDQTAAAMMLKGMTVHMLMTKCYVVKAGDTILVHAAAGGVGSIMCQWANSIGATVIGTVGTDDKIKLAESNGCKHVINYSKAKFSSEVRALTNGKGVSVVYDSVGLSTYKESLSSLENFGVLVTFGNASGPIPGIAPLELMQLGSLSVSRPTLMNYTSVPELREKASSDLFSLVLQGSIKIEIGQTFPLSKTADAHAAIENRKTTGSTVLIP